MARALRHNGLGLLFFVLFAAALAGQAVAGHAKYNEEELAHAQLTALIFLGSWFAQSVAGWSEYNGQQAEHMQSTIGWISYTGSADFWEATLQNWQSEFLAVGSMAVFSIYLRRRGSGQSKPVGAADTETATEG